MTPPLRILFHLIACAPGLLTGLLAALLPVVSLYAAAEAPSLTPRDATAYSASIPFGEPSSSATSTPSVIATTGNVHAENLSTETGGYRESTPVLTVTGKGSSVSVTVSAPPKGQSLLIEIREIHNRRPKAFGYTVLVNGREIYFRTYEELGSGPNHFFVQIPAEALGEGRSTGGAQGDDRTPGDPVTVTLRNEGAAPFSISHLWAYHDFAGHVAEPEGVYRPMGLLGFLLPDALPKPSFHSFSPIGRLSAVQYGSGNLEKGRETLVKSLHEGAGAGGMTLWMLNGTLWGGKPYGPDGQGGYFSDPRYSSIGYNPETGRYNPSWPSMWGSTASPSLQEKWMGRFLETRFRKVMDGIQTEIDFLKARGATPNLGLIREWGVSSTECSQGSIDGAKAVGLTLDPAKGLGPKERRWIFRDGVRLWKDYAVSMRREIERDSVTVDRGNVMLPTTQVRDNLYSQPNFLADWSVGREVWNTGEQAMVPGFWGSGELGQGKLYRELAMYDYLRARGRLSMVNMERTILKDDFSVLRNHYARGFEFLTLFNDEKGDEKLIAAMDNCDNNPGLPAVHREPTLLALDFCNGKSLGPSEGILSVQNLEIGHAKGGGGEHRAPRLRTVDQTKPGEITYKLANGGETFPAALSMHLDGRISKEPGNSIVILAGPNPLSLQEVRTLTAKDLPTPDHWTMHVTSETSVDLGAAMVGKKEWCLRLVVHSPSASDGAFLLSLSVGSQWARKSGYLDGNPLNARQERTMQLWVQDRAVAGNMLEDYALTALASIGLPPPEDRSKAAGLLRDQADALPREAGICGSATDLIDRGWYRSAYKLLAGEISQILPARFVVRGSGPLGCYPIGVTLPNADALVVITLEKLTPDRVEFSLSSEKGTQSVRLTFPALDASRGAGYWRLQKLGPNRYAVTPSQGGSRAGSDGNGDGTLSLVEGKVTADLVTEPAAVKKARPKSLTGRVLHGDQKRITIDTQDLEAMGYEQSLDLPVASGVVVTRKADRLADPSSEEQTWPRALDKVVLELNDRGEVARIDATYGRDRGRIKTFHPPVLLGKLSPGGIELENGRRYEFGYAGDTGTRFDTVGLHAHITNYEFPHLEQSLKPGEEVEVTYCPYTTEKGYPRLLRVAEPFKVLLEEDYTETKGGEWRAKALSVEGVDVVPHKPEPNYLSNVVVRLLRPTRFFQPGSITYKVSSDHPLGTTALEFAARAFEDSGRVEFLVSPDGKEWTKVGQFDNTWQNNYPQSTDSKSWKFPPQVVDLTPAVKGLKEFQLKIQLTCGDADDRFCFGRFRVLTGEGKP